MTNSGHPASRALFSLVIAASLCFGVSCSKGRKHPTAPPVGPRASGSDVIRTPRTAPPPLPVRKGPLKALDPFARMLPAQTEVLAVFPAATLSRAMKDVSESFIQLVLMEGSKALPDRLKDVYGVDPDGFGPGCALAVIDGAGAVLLCEGRGGKVENPPGHVLWKHSNASGHAVKRGKWRVFVGTVDGMLIAGNDAAVDRISMVRKGSWPALTTVIARNADILRPLAAANPWGDVSIYFLKPDLAPWCPKGACRGTAVFSKLGAETLLVADAADGKVKDVKTAVDSFWKGTTQGFARIRDTDRLARRPPITDAAIKPADLLVRNAVLTVRDFQISLKGPGNALFLAVILDPDIASAILGPPVELLEKSTH
ncbi:MAG: hypothetical protein GXP54_09040 [Deltaproteobacteria bacterium]|nr:hypothetical protein [Deltaproteobacteria bacterium]